MENKFKERLKELRNEKRILQAELAKDMKVCKSAISGWEVGRNQPDYDLLIKLADYFDVSLDYLLGKKEY